MTPDPLFRLPVQPQGDGERGPAFLLQVRGAAVDRRIDPHGPAEIDADARRGAPLLPRVERAAPHRERVQAPLEAAVERAAVDAVADFAHRGPAVPGVAEAAAV